MALLAPAAARPVFPLVCGDMGMSNQEDDEGRTGLKVTLVGHDAYERITDTQLRRESERA
jgi:hypothetical protein